MIFLDETGSLSNENIKDWVKKSKEEYQQTAGKRATDVVKLGLVLEEILINFQHTYGKDAQCQFVGKTKFGHIIFEANKKGERKDCFVVEDELSNSYGMLSRMGIYPKYSYRSANGGMNRATYEHPKKVRKNKMLIQLFIALILAILSHMLIQSLPEQIGTNVTDILINAIFPKICSIMAGLATPLVFFAVITGITGIGDAASFGKIGKKVCIRMLATYGIAALIMGLMGVLVYPVSLQVSTENNSALTEVVQLVLDMIPGNLVTPFSLDNDLQVIVIAIFIGFSMLILGDKAQHIKTLFEECSDLVNKMMMIVCNLIPLIVFLGILNMLCNSKISQIISMYKMLLVFLASSALVIVYMIIRTRIIMKKPFMEIFKYQIPTLMINLTTSSQVTALPENMKCCKEKFGIDEKLVDFALPFGMVTYMPNGAIFLGFTVWGIAAMNLIPITPFMIVKILLISVVIAIAAPPIPGSAFVVLPILLTSCGLSAEYMSLGIIFGTIAGYLCPALNGFCLQLELLLCAKKLHMIHDTSETKL